MVRVYWSINRAWLFTKFSQTGGLTGISTGGRGGLATGSWLMPYESVFPSYVPVLYESGPFSNPKTKTYKRIYYSMSNCISRVRQYSFVKIRVLSNELKASFLDLINAALKIDPI